MTACDYYLATPALQDVDAFLPLLAQGLATLPPAAVLVRLAEAPEPEHIKIIQKIQPLIQEQGIALMLEDRPALAKKTGCDGVHLTPHFSGSVRDVRKTLGDDLQLGAAVGTSRDGAMRAGEEGADYICFGQGAVPEGVEDALPDSSVESLTALAQWWCMVMELPAVVEVPQASELAGIVQSGVDFVMPDAAFWENPQAWHLPA